MNTQANKGLLTVLMSLLLFLVACQGVEMHNSHKLEVETKEGKRTETWTSAWKWLSIQFEQLLPGLGGAKAGGEQGNVLSTLLQNMSNGFLQLRKPQLTAEAEPLPKNL